jgi:hypothetical protein
MPKLVRHKTVKEALEWVADHPGTVPISIDMPMWEIISRNLFEHANNPDPRQIGSMARSVKAQKIILNRTTGTRRAGTHPATNSEKKVVLADLTNQAELNV